MIVAPAVAVQVSGKAFRELKATSVDTLDQRAQHILWPAMGGLATGASYQEPDHGKKPTLIAFTSILISFHA